MNKLTFISLLAGLIVGCSAPTGGSPVEPARAGTPTAEATQAVLKSPMPRKVIYTGEARLLCEDLDKAADKLELLIKQTRGYISHAERSGESGRIRRGSWAVRVPSEGFDAFLKSIGAIGEIQSSSRKAEDVSQEFYDSEARLRNKRVEEARLLEMLQSRTGKLADVITVEHELTRVREEIEVLQGRLRFLNNQSELSTVQITFEEVRNFVPGGSPGLGLKLSRAFADSLDALVEVATGGLTMLVALVPWVIPGMVLVLLVRWVAQRSRSGSAE